MRLLISFFRLYPWQSAIMLFALLLAGLAESVSLSALLPLINVAIGAESGAAESPAASTKGQGNDFEARVIEVLTNLGLSPTLGVLLTIIVVGVLFKNVLLLFAKKQVGYTAAQVTTHLRLALLRAILSSRWEYFLHQPIGRLANSMASEAIRVSQAYESSAMVLAMLIQTAVYTVVALLVSWQATLIGLGAGVVILLLSHFLVRMSKRAGKSQTKLFTSLLARLTDTLQSVKPLKAMARENLADGVLAAETNKLNRALQREAFSKAALEAAQEPMMAVVLAFGIYTALNHWEMPVATVTVLILVLARVLARLGKVQKQYQKMVVGESAFWSLQAAIRNAEEARESSAGTETPRLKSGICLDRVCFAYGNKAVLKNLSLEVPVGSLTTLVGVSGVGKTTVIDLITGLVRPQSGEIFIDNVPLVQTDLRCWRRKIGYVPQENLLLHDTVFNNVTLSDPELDDRDTETALRAAGAWEFVAALPDGIQSAVGERGAKLSGGQRQRIMIARALAHRPRLLILDEATSALDPQSEAAISKTLEQLRGKLTILAISHQPAMINVADRVYRLQDGVATLKENKPALSPSFP